MAEYIERELALSHPFANGQYDHKNANEEFILGHKSYKEWLEDLPTADVKPVVHGHWVRCKTNIGLYQCSECHFPEHEQYGILGNYCRNCGARMDEEREKMRLIDTDEIKLPQGFFEKIDNVPKFYEWLDEQPIVDAKPVVRGEWRLYSPFTDTYECNNCGYQVIDESFRTNFCPNCGADMRGKSDG